MVKIDGIVRPFLTPDMIPTLIQLIDDETAEVRSGSTVYGDQDAQLDTINELAEIRAALESAK